MSNDEWWWKEREEWHQQRAADQERQAEIEQQNRYQQERDEREREETWRRLDQEQAAWDAQQRRHDVDYSGGYSPPLHQPIDYGTKLFGHTNKVSFATLLGDIFQPRAFVILAATLAVLYFTGLMSTPWVTPIIGGVLILVSPTVRRFIYLVVVGGVCIFLLAMFFGILKPTVTKVDPAQVALEGCLKTPGKTSAACYTTAIESIHTRVESEETRYQQKVKSNGGSLETYWKKYSTFYKDLKGAIAKEKTPDAKQKLEFRWLVERSQALERHLEGP